MPLFLYTYTDSRNFARSRELGVFGAKADKPGLEAKVRRLAIGDLVVIRDGQWPRPRFLGTCIIAGEIQTQGAGGSQYDSHLWPDELVLHKVIYPLRAKADFAKSPRIIRSDVTWKDLAALKIHGEAGQPLSTSQQWGQVLYGNFIQDPSASVRFLELLGIAETPSPLA